MKLGLTLGAIALFAAPLFAVDQSYDRDMHRIYRNDTRHEVRDMIQRMHDRLSRDIGEMRANAYRTRMSWQRERLRERAAVRAEVRRAHAEALRERSRARAEARREALRFRLRERFF